jgi:integrase/recombinase XerC
VESSLNPSESPSWDSLIPRYREYLESGTLSPRTVELRLYHLNRIRKFVNKKPGDVLLEDLTRYFQGRTWVGNTRAVVRACMSVFFKWAADNEYLPKNPAARLMSVRVPQGKPKPASDEALEQALSSASEKVRLMVRLGERCGLRAMEIAAISTHDLEQDELGWVLRVLGKGSKVRLIPLADDFAAELLNRKTGFVFPGKIDGHVSPAYVSRLVSSVLPAGVTAHKLRHRFATKALRGSNNNLRAVQELLGHSSIATTQVYTGIGNDQLRQAALSAS